MKISPIKFISQKFAKSTGKRRFAGFARYIAFGSVLLGTVALILSLSILEGFDIKLRQTAVSFTSHISVKTFNREPIRDEENVEQLITTHFKSVKSIMPIIEREGIIKSKSYTEGVLFRGIDPARDITGMKKYVLNGAFTFSDSNAREMILGSRLAKKLNVGTGDTILIFAIEESYKYSAPKTRIGKFKIQAIYRSGMAQYDDMVTYIPFNTAREFFNMPEGSAGTIEVMLNDISKAENVGKGIESMLRYPFFSLTVFDIHRPIFAWIELQKEPIPIVLGLISIVAVLNIITTLLILVVEKTRSIGVLRAMGMKSRDIVAIFLYQGVKIGASGTVAGSIIAWVLCLIQQKYEIIKLKGEIYFLDALPIDISVWHYVIVISITIALAALATLIPAIVASKVSPVKALRFK